MSNNNPDPIEKRDLAALPVQIVDDKAFPEQSLNTMTDGVVIGSLHSGPLPTPENFAAYDLTCPGAAREILDMAKSQHQHRQKMEKQVEVRLRRHQKNVFEWHERKHRIDQNFALRGQWMSFALVVLYFGLIAYMGFLGYETVAGIGLGAAVVFGLPKIISQFISQRKPQTPGDDTSENLPTKKTNDQP